MRDSKHAIEINNLTKFFGDLQALDNVSFSVKRGDFFAFLGPNGAGKTTTINALTGLSNFKSGEIKIFG
ncbi:MAG TPA: ATP-binding cassette domain-containing protein, partial [Candidatus Omnitrophota bacterium]|nr:ATP-binding cassette domain-containing protein [Candidatus Omnitrophota bacterium]